MNTNYNQSNNFILTRKFNISRENNNHSSIKVNKKNILPRCKSSGNNLPNNGNHHNGIGILNFDYNKNLEGTNSQIKDFNFYKELPQTKQSYKQNFIIDKENENKSKKSNNQPLFGGKRQSINNNSILQINKAVRKGPYKLNQIYMDNQKIGIDKTGKNKNDFYPLYYNERQNSLPKKKDEIENCNPNKINSYENYLNSLKLKNEEIKPKNFSNKNLDVEKYKETNNLKEKEKNVEFIINKDKSIKISEKLNEIKDLKKINEQYKLIISEKDNEINSLKQSNEEYESILKEKNNEIKILKQKFNELKEKDNGINILKQKIIELNKNNEQYNSIIKGKDNEIKILKQNNEKYELIIKKKVDEMDYFNQKINELEKNNKKYEAILNEKDNEINCLQQKINELNIINKQNIIFKNKEQELKRKEIEIMEREEEINKKINFLEDKENQLENEIKEKQKMILKFQDDIEENKKIKLENNNLILKNQELQKENQEFESIKIKLQKENAILNQKNLELSSFIKKLENKSQFHKKSNSADYKKINRVVPKPLETYNNPTLVGLNNIGATCFMNSTLQCLSQTKALANYFLYEKNKEAIRNNNIALKNKNGYQLSPVFQNLIQKLWEKNGPNSFSPNTFMNTINNMNPLFKTGQAGDAKDFIIFILEQLHKELKKSVQNNFNNSNNATQLNQYDKNNAFNHFFNDFKKECSVISDIFFGFNETTNECLNCRNIYYSKGLNNPICYNYGIFNCLIFPLEEVKNMKNNQMQNYNIQICNNRVSLYDCFFYNQKSELFSGDNRNYCNVCKQLYDSIYTSKIFISPTVLVIILNRGRGNIYDVKLDFSETIDITQFVQQKDSPQIIYNLYGVITHIGQSGPNAHFVASCKSPIDNKWYRYNDAFVNPINNLQKEVIDFGTPYILFYLKNN